MATEVHSALLGEVEEAAGRLRAEVRLGEDWVARVMAHPGAGSLLAAARRVLDAEGSGACFETGHFEEALPLKAELDPAACGLIAELLGQCFPERVPADGQSAHFGAFDAERVKGVAGGVIEDGYAPLGEALAAPALEGLTAVLGSERFRSRVDGAEATGDELARGAESRRGVWWLIDTAGVGARPELQALALDPFVLAVAQEALGTAPIHVQTNCWWSFRPPGLGLLRRKRQRSRNAQMFHRDQEFITFVKVFLHLSDVDSGAGPHVFVAGSHRQETALDAGARSSKRRKDRQIVAHFGQDRVREITGPRGTATMVNTRGFHKGAPVRRGHRHLLQLEYASSMFFNPVKPFDRARLGPAGQDLAGDVPRVVMNYR